MGYRQFHGLTMPAFSKAIVASDLLVYPQLEELVEELLILTEDGGIGVVDGAIGIGKTTSLRYTVGRMGDACQVCYAGSNRHPTALLQELIEGLGLLPARHRAALLRQLSQRVERTFFEQRKKTMVIIDDAHLLEDSLLEDFRLLSNFNMDGSDPLVLLFVGHPALRRKLQAPVHLALWDRVRVHYRLEGLSRDESVAYIDCHMKAAGGSGALFTDGAKHAIFDTAQGIPRRINALALSALKKSASRKVAPIDETIVTLAHNQLKAD